jgi:hypothetical protein
LSAGAPREGEPFGAHLVAGLDEPARRFLLHAIAEGTPLAPAARLTMHGWVRAGAWLPFRATQDASARAFSWRARVGLGPLTVLRVVDRYGAGEAVTDVRLLGRVGLAHADDPDTVRSAAGRAALEAVMYAPGALLFCRDARWRAVADDEVVVAWDVGPVRPEVHVRVGPDGALRGVHALRWGRHGTEQHQEIPCGADVHELGRFGPWTLPRRFEVAWWYGTPRRAPFFRARIDAWAPERTALQGSGDAPSSGRR